MLAYLLLLLAIASEVTATSLLPRSAGFTVLWPTVVVLVGYGLSFVLLAQVVKSVPVGVAYAIWSGLGTVAIVAIGAMFLSQPLNAWQLTGVGLVVVGVVLINLTGNSTA